MRTLVRIVLALIGTLLILAGVGSAAATWWVERQLTVNAGRWVLQTPPEVIASDGCSVVLVEVSSVELDPGDIDTFDPVASRSETVFTVSAEGTSANGWLVGTTASAPVEDRLLGARYCVAQNQGPAWAVTSIEVEKDSPILSIDGLTGVWANAADGEKVILPVPSAGETIVVSGGRGSDLDSIAVGAEYRIDGGTTLGLIGLVGGAITVVLGSALLVISIWGLRRRGRHEAGAS